MALGIESFLAIWLSQLKFLMNEFLIKKMCAHEMNREYVTLI